MAGGGGQGSVYVDGFSDGRFPPNDTIREIRIKQNPFYSQYSDLGLDRIEVFTKPGSDKLHSSFLPSGSTKAFNSLNLGRSLPSVLAYSSLPPGSHVNSSLALALRRQPRFPRLYTRDRRCHDQILATRSILISKQSTR